ncbi:MAG: hypothetical protein KatS3mg111_2516 [Pirellulaceae bacterium]|nr:MAG: hypothetical protein KatS3mg111_2516 [Pirellulaceae bacterium]
MCYPTPGSRPELDHPAAPRLKVHLENSVAFSELGWLVIRVPRAALPAATPLSLCPGLSWRCPFGANCGADGHLVWADAGALLADGLP